MSAHQPPTQQLKEKNFTRAYGIVPRARLKAPLFFRVASKWGRCGAEQKCVISHSARVPFRSWRGCSPHSSQEDGQRRSSFVASHPPCSCAWPDHELNAEIVKPDVRGRVLDGIHRHRCLLTNTNHLHPTSFSHRHNTPLRFFPTKRVFLFLCPVTCRQR